MLYTEPNISLNSFYEDPETRIENPASNSEILSSTFDQIKTGEEFFSGHYNLVDVYDNHIERVKKLTGKEFANPQLEFDGQSHNDWAEHQRQGGTLSWKAFARNWYETKFRNQLRELAEQRPELRDQLLPEKTFQELAIQRRKDADQRAQEVWERSDKGTSAHLAWFAGTLGAGLTDPINYLTAGVGFSGAALGAKGLAMAFLKNGAANAAVETGVQFLPGGVVDERTAAGQYAGLDYSAMTIGGAFALGGALDTTFRGIARGLHYGLGYKPIVKNDIVVGWQKPGKPEVSADLVKQADAGDTGAIRELTEQTDLADNPIVRNTLDAMDADEKLAQKPTIREDRPVADSEQRSIGILDQDHATAVKQAVRSASDPDIEPPIVRIEETPSGPDMEFDRFKDYAIRVIDSIDDRIAEAVDDAIASADPNAPIVIARAFREHPELVTDTVPFDDARFAVGRQLAGLSDEAFERIEAGDVSGGLGRLVADHVADPADHVKVLDFLQQIDPPTEAAARMAIGEMIQSPEIRKPAPDAIPAVKLPEKQLDDPHGPQARQQIDELEAEFSEELGRLTEEAVPVEEAAPAMTARADEVRAAIDEVAGTLPEGTEVRTFDDVADLPEVIRAHVELSHATRLADAQKRFQAADSDAERLAARAEMDDAKSGRLVEALEDDGTIWIASWAIDPKGRVAHEAVHALVNRGLMSPDELSLLAKVSRDTEIFDAETSARYRTDFEARVAGQNIDRLMDEEAAAHLLEAFARGERPAQIAPDVTGIVQRLMDVLERIGNFLRSRGFVNSIEAENAQIADIVDEFLSGELAKRPAVQEWMRVNQTGQKNLMHAFRAYHGSPHDFDKFSMDKIGTGEGAQAYGHGLYFAENPKVATQYRDDLAPASPDPVFLDHAGKEVSGATETAAFLLDRHKNSSRGALDSALYDASVMQNADAVSAEVQRLAKGAKPEDRVTKGPPRESSGNLYEVNIKANKDDFLDWDKPLRGQSQNASAAFRNMVEDVERKTLGRDPALGPVPEELSRLKDRLQQFHGRQNDTPLGQWAAAESLDKATLAAMKDSGIPGIKYLDGNSRASGQGTYNYVIFDDNLIEITAKNGEPVSAEVREGVVSSMRDGQDGPMYAMRSDRGRAKFGAKERAEQLKADLDEIEARFQAADGDERTKLHVKRAALLNAKAQERILDDIASYRDQFGRSNRAKGFMFQIESFGEAAAQDLKHTKDVIEDKAQSMMSEVLWEFRKGMITGDKRRSIGPIKRRLENMIRAASGEQVDDDLSNRMAHAWLNVAEYLRQRFNAAGGDIRKLEGWYSPQFHDAEALLKARSEKWIDYLMKEGVLDWHRMGVDPGERRAFLQHAFETITSDGANSRKDVEGLGRGALYKRHADHRVIHFQNADGWIAYNKLYGGGDIYAAMLGHISMMSRDIAMMERFGANPNVVFDRISNTLRNDALRARTASSLLDDLDFELERLNGEVRGRPSVVDPIMKRMGIVHKELESLRRKGRGRYPAGKGKIGKKIYELDMELMELHDQLRTATASAESETQARIAAVLDQIEAAEQFSATSRNPVESTEYYIKRASEMMKAFKGDSSVPISNGFAGAMSASRNLVGAGILSGASISALTDQTISMGARALNGMPVRTQISSFLKGFTVHDRKLAMEAAVGLDQVRVSWQEQARYLGNIDARGVTGFLADRTHAYSFLSPMTQAAKVGFSLDFMRFMVRMQSHQWNRLPAPARRMLERHGFSSLDWGQLRTVKPTEKKMSTLLTRDNIADALGEDMAERYAVMMLRERGGAVLESTIRGRTLWVSDQQPGTLLGELTRSVAMLKSFPTSFSYLVLNRLYREMSNKASNTAGYATFLFLGGAILGGLVIQLKNIAYGRDPDDMSEPEFWYRSLLQSGGAGIYGDFINSSSNRFNGGIGGTLLGPMGEFINAPLSMTLGSAIRYARDESTNPGREFAKYARRYTPVLPFYTRLAYDRLVIDNLQEMIDPNYHQSFRSKINHLRRSRGQRYYWPPGQDFSNSRLPDLSEAIQ